MTTPTAFILRTASGQHELSIQGHLSHPHWVVWLFSGLSHLKIDVVSGQITRTPSLSWDARLRLDFANSTTLPERLDYIVMAQSKPAIVDLSPPQLNRFQITRRENGLEVWLEGPDQSGFLGRLLGKLSLLMLFPAQITIATIAGRINDRVLLQGIGGSVPAPNSEASLNALLQSFVTA